MGCCHILQQPACVGGGMAKSIVSPNTAREYGDGAGHIGIWSHGHVGDIWMRKVLKEIKIKRRKRVKGSRLRRTVGNSKMTEDSKDTYKLDINVLA